MQVVLSPIAFERIVRHLIEMEENIDDIVEQYFPRPSKERNEFRALLEQYIVELDLLVRNAKQSEAAENLLPFVAIGSKVEVADQLNHDVFQVCITGPSYEGEDLCGQLISFLSPMGMSLLLKNRGDEIVVHAPGGSFRYIIHNIKMEIGATS